jgi:membrane protein DedA with SNARE-associated domain
MSRTNQVVSSTLVLLLFLLIFSLALFAASYLEGRPDLQSTIAGFGYPGILLIAIIAGLNVLVPVPAASLVPVFTTAGLYLPFIILCLTLGTVIADYIGFRFGRFSSTHVRSKYPRIVQNLERIHHSRRNWLLPTVFVYAAFIPFPNEALVLPLAILGIPFRIMFLPLLVGNFVNQTIYAVGIQNVFWWLF